VAKARKVWEERALSQAHRPDRQWIVDEAQEMSDEMLQELRFLRNQAMGAQAGWMAIHTTKHAVKKGGNESWKWKIKRPLSAK